MKNIGTQVENTRCKYSSIFSLTIMPLLLFIGLILFLLVLGYFYLKRLFTQGPNDVAGQEPQLFFGNLINSGMITGKATFHEVMLNYQRQYGDKFLFWFGSHPIVTFCLPKHAQAIFTNRQAFDQSPLFLPNFDLLCPHSIFMPTGPKWKRHIRVMLPMFKKAKVIHHLDTIVECTDRLIAQHIRNGDIHRDLLTQCRSLTMNIIGWIAFDYDFESDLDRSLKEACQTFIFHATSLMIIPGIPRWLIRLYLRLNWKYQRAHRLIRQFTEKIVEQEQNNPQVTANERPKNLIASLVSSLNEQANDEQISSGLTRAEMLDEVLVSILAGYETTSTSLSWFLFYISKHPHIQQRIKDELREHDLLATNDGDCLPALTYEKIQSLVYCECVTKEVLRCAPVAGATTRLATEDTTVDGVKIRRGQTLLVAINNINKDSRYWHHTDPNDFAPERFLAGDKDHHSYAMLPFGGGHRACIGQDLAWFELKTIIIRMMQRGLLFEDTPENTGGFEDQLTCYPKHLAVRIRFDREKIKS